MACPSHPWWTSRRRRERRRYDDCIELLAGPLRCPRCCCRCDPCEVPSSGRLRCHRDVHGTDPSPQPSRFRRKGLLACQRIDLRRRGQLDHRHGRVALDPCDPRLGRKQPPSQPSKLADPVHDPHARSLCRLRRCGRTTRNRFEQQHAAGR